MRIKLLRFLMSILLFGCFTNANAQEVDPPVEDTRIRIACVGNSITEGFGLESKYAYPAVLGRVLGDKYNVQNFGHSGRTVMKNSADPNDSYWASDRFTRAKEFNPDIVIFGLGSNDARTAGQNNWNGGDNKFKEDLEELLTIFKELPKKPKVYVSIPPYIISGTNFYNPPAGSTPSSETLVYEITPMIEQAIARHGFERNETYHLFYKRDNWYRKGDGVHPSEHGAYQLGLYMAASILKTPIITAPGSVDFPMAIVNQRGFEKLRVTGKNLTGNLALKMSGEGFELSAATITKTQAEQPNGYEIDVYFTAKEVKSYTGSIEISGGGIETQTITLTGQGKSEQMYILGGATPGGWNISERLPMEYANGKFSWIGYLAASDFKFFPDKNKNTWTPYISTPRHGIKVVADGNTQQPYAVMGYNDSKFNVPVAGFHTVTLDLKTQTITTKKESVIPLYLVGNASPTGWNNLTAEKMEIKDGLAQWEGYLKEGDLKFLGQRRAWFPAYNAPNANFEVKPGETHNVLFNPLNTTSDNKFIIKTPNFYTIKVNENKNTVLIEKKEYTLWATGSALGNRIVKLDIAQRDDFKYFRYTGAVQAGELKFITTPAITSETRYVVPETAGASGVGYSTLKMTTDASVAGWKTSVSETLSISISLNNLEYIGKRDSDEGTYVVGDLTNSAWDNSKGLRMDYKDWKYTWEGHVKKGAFKFIAQLNAWYPSYNARYANQAVESGKELHIRKNSSGSADFKFAVSTPHFYTMELDLLTNILVAKEKNYELWATGSALKGKIAKLTINPQDPTKYTLNTELRSGELRLMTTATEGVETRYIVPAKASGFLGTSTLQMSKDVSVAGWKVAGIGDYQIDVSLSDLNFLGTRILPKPAYIIGDVVPGKWNLNKGIEITAVDSTFIWSGFLESGRMKILAQSGTGFPAYVSKTVDQNIEISKVMEVLYSTTTANDHKFMNGKSGFYEVILDYKHYTLQLNPVKYDLWATGSAVDNKTVKLTVNADDPTVFTYEGGLRTGELKIMTTQGVNANTKYLVPVTPDDALFAKTKAKLTGEASEKGWNVKLWDRGRFTIKMGTLEMEGEKIIPESLNLVGAIISDGGWKPGNGYPMKKDGNFYKWSGFLKQGDFKLVTQLSANGWFPCYNAADGNKNIKLGDLYDLRYNQTSGNDHKFNLASSGFYVVEAMIENNRNAIKVNRINYELWATGSAVDGKVVKLVSNPDDSTQIHFAGTLKTGDLYLMTTPTPNANTKYVSPGASTSIIGDAVVFKFLDSPDAKAWKISTPEKYLIKVDMSKVKITGQKDLPPSIYLVGAVTPNGWTDPQGIKLTSNKNIHTWEGYLKNGDFKFIISSGDWLPNYGPPRANESIVEGKNMAVIYNEASGSDYKYTLQRSGNFKMSVNLETGNLVVKSTDKELWATGSALEDKIVKLDADPTSTFKFALTTTLKAGDLKFIDTPNITAATTYYLPASASSVIGENALVLSQDKEKAGWTVEKETKYTLALDIDGKTFAGKEESAVIPPAPSKVWMTGSALGNKVVELTAGGSNALFTYSGKLKTGDLKIMDAKTELLATRYILPKANTNLIGVSAVQFVAKGSAGMTKWTVSGDDDYSLELNLTEMTLTGEKIELTFPTEFWATGSALDNKPVKLSNTTTGNANIFKLLTQLKAGELIIIGSQTIGADTKYVLPIATTDIEGISQVFVTNNGSQSNWKVKEMAEYSLTLDITEKTFAVAKSLITPPTSLWATGTAVGGKVVRLTVDPNNATRFTYRGDLLAGDLQLIGSETIGADTKYVLPTATTSVVGTSTVRVTKDASQSKWTIDKADEYDLSVNLGSMEFVGSKYIIPTPTALWAIGTAIGSQPVKLTADAGNPSLFTYAGELQAGDLQLINTATVGADTRYILPATTASLVGTTTIRIVKDGAGSKWTVSETEGYSFSVNLAEMKFVGEKKPILPTDLWMTGTAVDNKPVKLTVDASTDRFIYSGELKEGDLQLISTATIGATTRYLLPTATIGVVGTSVMHVASHGTNSKWTVSETEDYDLSIDLSDLTFVGTKKPVAIPTEVWMTGAAVGGSTVKLTVDTSNPSKFTYTGNLMTGDLQLTNTATIGADTRYVLPIATTGIIGTSSVQIVKDGSKANWAVDEMDEYTLSVDFDQMKFEAAKAPVTKPTELWATGTAVDNKTVKLTVDAGDANKFTYSGELKKGELKLIGSATIGQGTKYVLPVSPASIVGESGMHVVKDGSKTSWTVDDVDEYNLTVNLTEMKFVGSKAPVTKPTELWATGSAVDNKIIKLTVDANNAGKFTFSGDLKAGDLKLIGSATINENTKYVLPVSTASIIGTSTMQVVRDGAVASWTVNEADGYDLSVDLVNMTFEGAKIVVVLPTIPTNVWATGTAVDNKIVKLTIDAIDANKFNYIGELKAGDLKLISTETIGEDTDYILPVVSADLIGSSPVRIIKDVAEGWVVTDADSYNLSVDFASMTFTGKKEVIVEPTLPAELWVTGTAVDNKTVKMTVSPGDEKNFTYVGDLKAGTLKLISTATIGTDTQYVLPTTPAKVVGTSTVQILNDEGIAGWTVDDAGKYNLAVSLRDFAFVGTKETVIEPTLPARLWATGTAVKGAIVQLTVDASDPTRFTYTGDMEQGELKLISTATIGADTEFVSPTTSSGIVGVSNVGIAKNPSATGWTVGEIGEYSLVVDLTSKTFTGSKKPVVVPVLPTELWAMGTAVGSTPVKLTVDATDATKFTYVGEIKAGELKLISTAVAGATSEYVLPTASSSIIGVSTVHILKDGTGAGWTVGDTGEYNLLVDLTAKTFTGTKTPVVEPTLPTELWAMGTAVGSTPVKLTVDAKDPTKFSYAGEIKAGELKLISTATAGATSEYVLPTASSSIIGVSTVHILKDGTGAGWTVGEAGEYNLLIDLTAKTFTGTKTPVVVPVLPTELWATGTAVDKAIVRLTVDPNDATKFTYAGELKAGTLKLISTEEIGTTTQYILPVSSSAIIGTSLIDIDKNDTGVTWTVGEAGEYKLLVDLTAKTFTGVKTPVVEPTLPTELWATGTAVDKAIVRLTVDPGDATKFNYAGELKAGTLKFISTKEINATTQYILPVSSSTIVGTSLIDILNSDAGRTWSVDEAGRYELSVDLTDLIFTGEKETVIVPTLPTELWATGTAVDKAIVRLTVDPGDATKFNYAGELKAGTLKFISTKEINATTQYILPVSSSTIVGTSLIDILNSDAGRTWSVDEAGRYELSVDLTDLIFTGEKETVIVPTLPTELWATGTAVDKAIVRLTVDATDATKFTYAGELKAGTLKLISTEEIGATTQYILPVSSSTIVGTSLIDILNSDAGRTWSVDEAGRYELSVDLTDLIFTGEKETVIVPTLPTELWATGTAVDKAIVRLTVDPNDATKFTYAGELKAGTLKLISTEEIGTTTQYVLPVSSSSVIGTSLIDIDKNDTGVTWTVGDTGEYNLLVDLTAKTFTGTKTPVIVPVLPTELWATGTAVGSTPVKLTVDATDATKFTYVGEIKAGELKLISTAVAGATSEYVLPTASSSIIGVSTVHILKDGTGAGWTVGDTGEYNLLVDLTAKTFTGTKTPVVVPTLPTELWAIGTAVGSTPVKLTVDATDATKFTYAGEIKVGTLKLISTAVAGATSEYVLPTASSSIIGVSTVHILKDGTGAGWTVGDTGEYNLLVDLTAKTFTGTKTPVVVPVLPTELWAIGTAVGSTPVKLTVDATDATKFTYAGEIKVGTLKLISTAVAGATSEYVLPTASSSIIGVSTVHILKDGTGAGWTVGEAGEYNLLVDLTAKTFTGEKVEIGSKVWATGSALNNEIIELSLGSVNSDDNLRYLGALSVGELKLMTTPTVTPTTRYLVPTTTNISVIGTSTMRLTSNTGIAGWKVAESSQMYRLEVDLVAMTLTGEMFTPSAMNEFYLLGGATQAGWSVGKAIAIEQLLGDPNIFTVDADLRAGSNSAANFKILGQRAWSGYSLVPYSEIDNTLAGVSYFKVIDGNVAESAEQWSVSKDDEGRYRITINRLAETITFTYLSALEPLEEEDRSEPHISVTYDNRIEVSFTAVEGEFSARLYTLTGAVMDAKRSVDGSMVLLGKNVLIEAIYVVHVERQGRKTVRKIRINANK